MRRYLLAMVVLLSATIIHAAELRVELTIDKPARIAAQMWPLSVGVPLPAGACSDVANLRILDASGQEAPAQIVKTGSWDDGSVRWARVDFQPRLDQRYFLAPGTGGKRTPPATSISIRQSDGAVAVNTGAAHYVFRKGQGCFEQIDLVMEGKLTPLVQQAGDAFYVLDSQGRRGVLKGKDLRVELDGPLHAVVRIEGEYLTEQGQRNAAGVTYYHFFAGLPWVRISHKLIVTEETLDLWFRDIGMSLPVTLPGPALASFNDDHGNLASVWQGAVGAEHDLAMVQSTFPHFGKTDSIFTIQTIPARAGAAGGTEHKTGAAAGDWADLSSAQVGLAAQMPGFAEQFPTAFRIAQDRLTVKFWAGEAGRELDFRTASIIKDYFGHDWIPADHKLAQIPNTARSSSKTHDLWLYPHAGPLTPEVSRGFAATRDEIYATPDPAWVAQSGAMDRFHPHDPTRFPQIEAAIEDYFVRHVSLPEKVFPNTGYIAWGRNPYSVARWEIKNDRWYPSLHRFSRTLEYNLKRGVWVLYARSGQRQYREYARRYSRFLHDFTQSNWDTGLKPKGWFIQGDFNAAAFWGSFDEKTIREDTRPSEFISETAALGYGTSEDVIQFVYDWFMSGDYHCRDAAQSYKDALLKELKGDVDRIIKVAVPIYVFLRPAGSAYELDRDPKLYELGHRVLERVVAPAGSPDVVNTAVPQNYVKDGEIWAGFYHYYVSTGDKLALDPLYRVAERYYRTNRVGLIYRGSGMPQAFTLQYEKTGDPAYLANLRQTIEGWAQTPGSLKERGIRLEEVTQAFDQPWGHMGAITDASPVTIGIPVALRALAQAGEAPLPRVPLALKPVPTSKTHLFFRKEQPGPARVDLYVNNLGDLKVEPKLFDAQGKPAGVKIIEHEAHTVDKPHGDATWQHFHNVFNGTFGTHLFYRLQIDGPPGVYRLDAGEQVRTSVLFSEMNQFLQVAPDGLVLDPAHSYYATLPAGLETLELFAHRPVGVTSPDGRKVVLEPLGGERFRVAIGGKPGPWRIDCGADKLVYNTPFTRVQALVKFLNAPMVVALDQPQRLFEVDAAALASAVPKDLPQATQEPAFAEGRFGQAALLAPQQVVKLAPLEGAPREQGTVEFWFRPLWSTTDIHLGASANSVLQQQLLSMSPILVSHIVQAIDGGRSPNYLRSHLHVALLTDPRPVPYPVVMFLEAGRWYHVAVTWRVDGKDSDVEVFVNGRRKTYAWHYGAIPADLTPQRLPPPAEELAFGSAVGAGVAAERGQMFDELRVSRSIRYTQDFQPPRAPLERDADTFLLMHMDGDWQAQAGAQTIEGKAAKARKLR